MSEVSIKFLMPMKVASTEKRVPREELSKAVEQISQSLKEKKVKIADAAMGLLHEDPKSIDLQKAQFEVCLPISGKIKGEGELKSKELEKGAFACITHSGPIEKLPDAYKTILKWIEENGYKIASPIREVYHKGVGEVGGIPQDVLIEIQCPVRK
ncbi:MAG: GyrI-like domain-containing protein [Thermodesulfobacteriota bacterium]|jgi:effector-binding domain-containing protein